MVHTSGGHQKISAKSDLFAEEWIGRKVNKDFLRYLKENNIDICGENGEYHTFVTDGPLFKKKIKISKSKTIMREGYWFLDTLEYSLENLTELSHASQTSSALSNFV